MRKVKADCMTAVSADNHEQEGGGERIRWNRARHGSVYPVSLSAKGGPCMHVRVPSPDNEDTFSSIHNLYMTGPSEMTGGVLAGIARWMNGYDSGVLLSPQQELCSEEKSKRRGLFLSGRGGFDKQEAQWRWRQRRR